MEVKTGDVGKLTISVIPARFMNQGPIKHEISLSLFGGTSTTPLSKPYQA